MGDSASKVGLPRYVLAALPFAIALAFSAASLNSSLAPLKGAGQMHLEQAPGAPAHAPAHHDDPLDDSAEPVDV